MGFGVNGAASLGEHETTRNQKLAWSQQQAAQQQQQQAGFENGREMFERGLLGQEQSRKQYDSETARQVGAQKYNVLGGLLQGITSNAMGSGGGYQPSSGLAITRTRRM